MHPSFSFRVSVFWLVVLGLIALLPSSLSAQSTGGRIVGRVADPTGAVLSGVKVTLVNEATGASRDAQTNDSGDYNFVSIPPGVYRLEFEETGFKKNLRKGVTLEVNQIV